MVSYSAKIFFTKFLVGRENPFRYSISLTSWKKLACFHHHTYLGDNHNLSSHLGPKSHSNSLTHYFLFFVKETPQTSLWIRIRHSSTKYIKCKWKEELHTWNFKLKDVKFPNAYEIYISCKMHSFIYIFNMWLNRLGWKLIT